MLSNRESARRSRRRKQAHLGELQLKVNQLQGENQDLLNKLHQLHVSFNSMMARNRMIKDNMAYLRVQIMSGEPLSREALVAATQAVAAGAQSNLQEFNNLVVGGPGAGMNTMLMSSGGQMGVPYVGGMGGMACNMEVNAGHPAVLKVKSLRDGGNDKEACPPFVAKDLNIDPVVPYPDASFDFVTCVVSVDYLNKPLEVFDELRRVLRPGGQALMAISNRCFPTKAIQAFHQLSLQDRVGLVASYMSTSEAYDTIEFADRSPTGADPLWLVYGRTPPR